MMKIRVCSLCREAVRQEAQDMGLSPIGNLSKTAIELGGDISDHSCKRVEQDKTCSCSCGGV